MAEHRAPSAIGREAFGKTQRAFAGVVRAGRLAGVLLLAFCIGGCMGLFSGERPSYLGVKDGRLAPCKTTPNCVSSYGDKVNDPGHYVEPLRPNGDPAAAFAQLTAIVRDTERVTVMKSEPRYLYAEFKTRIMGFVDDVEFLLDEHDLVIHVRSASRIGRSDFGVNRARIESLRAALGAASA